MRRLLKASVVASAFTLMLAPAAWGSPADVWHNVGHPDVILVLDDQVSPCLGEGDFILTLNGNQRSVTNDNVINDGESITATWKAVLDAGGTSAGRGNLTYGTQAQTGQDAVFHLSWNGVILSGVGAGTRWRYVEHFNGPVDLNGDFILDFAKVAFARLNCS